MQCNAVEVAYANKSNQSTHRSSKPLGGGDCDLSLCTFNCTCTGSDCAMDTCGSLCTCTGGSCNMEICDGDCKCAGGSCDMSSVPVTDTTSSCTGGGCTISKDLLKKEEDPKFNCGILGKVNNCMADDFVFAQCKSGVTGCLCDSDSGVECDISQCTRDCTCGGDKGGCAMPKCSKDCSCRGGMCEMGNCGSGVCNNGEMGGGGTSSGAWFKASIPVITFAALLSMFHLV